MYVDVLYSFSWSHFSNAAVWWKRLLLAIRCSPTASGVHLHGFDSQLRLAEQCLHSNRLRATGARSTWQLTRNTATCTTRSEASVNCRRGCNYFPCADRIRG